MKEKVNMHILRLSECLCEYFNYASFSATEKNLRCIYLVLKESWRRVKCAAKSAQGRIKM